MIGVERFLHCLSLSVHAGEFVLKGSMLFDVWNRRMHRLTRDLDLLGAGAANVESVRNCMPGSLFQDPFADSNRSTPRPPNPLSISVKPFV